MATETTAALQPSEIGQTVRTVVETTPVLDMHTHLFAPQFGSLNLWGIDELLGYHYLIAELFRVSDIRYDQFWGLTKAQQADLIWAELFVRRTPLSEATQGVCRVMAVLGLDPSAPDLREARAFYAKQSSAEYVDKVLDLAGVSSLVMTNDPLDPEESLVWRTSTDMHPRFHAALRLDQLLITWPDAAQRLRDQGFDVSDDVSGNSFHEARRYLSGWIERMKPLYMAVSLPSSFSFPDESTLTRLLRGVVMPTCLEHRLPLALMIGVQRQLNPNLRLAGDGVGRADVGSLVRLVAEYPQVRVLTTFLSRENQHELCVVARKFRSILPFGCWWFLNNPSIVDEITRERVEMLGSSFIAQHSDARVLDQLIYKWANSRKAIAIVLTDAYTSLAEAGRDVRRSDIVADVNRMLCSNFAEWVGLAPDSAATG